MKKLEQMTRAELRSRINELEDQNSNVIIEELTRENKAYDTRMNNDFLKIKELKDVLKKETKNKKRYFRLTRQKNAQIKELSETLRQALLYSSELNQKNKQNNVAALAKNFRIKELTNLNQAQEKLYSDSIKEYDELVEELIKQKDEALLKIKKRYTYIHIIITYIIASLFTYICFK